MTVAERFIAVTARFDEPPVDETADTFIEQFEDQGAAAVIHHFDNPSELRTLLSPQRVALIRELQREPADSVTELADRLNRKNPQVSNDLSVLEHAGIVHFREGEGREKAPFVPYERVHIEAEVTVAGEQ
ncbi:helix-turn-helix domain-containing protein [Haloarcula sp. Atlit-7R]|uniref:HVO_A0114 family putative DNA-binding protein n=1 Tax=Haloarcula sp. Atlit-7R TaxID=2282125 RepID=UPI000EF14DDD|nr:helix-turn-helix domain-containing protein [Haloarcula sp. Atlit-7R]RLM84098.1 ArsR family transcriptional regulator [Haloarcula sp. Atlit-7R]